MNKKLTLLFLIISNITFAQFTLDDKIKPIALELKENSATKDAKGIAVMHSLGINQTAYFTVKGHDLFQFIDVYVFANNGEADLKVDIVVANWADSVQSKNTKSGTDEIANFKFRTIGSFGIKISSNEKKIVPFSIVISATPPVKNYLNSPFRKIRASDNINVSEKEKNNTNNANTKTESSANSSTTLLYVIIGLLVLIVLILAFKKKKSNINMMLLLFLFTGFSQPVFSQNISFTPEQTQTIGQMLSREGESEKALKRMIKDQMQREGRTSTMDSENTLKKFNSVVSRINSVQGKLSTATNIYSSTKELYDSYENLSTCINSSSLPGLPRVPSFCVDNQCKKCFTDARRKFNDLRYKFEKLQAIYDCTKRFSQAAIAFGDNASGIHAVTGLAWQTQRIKIQKSVVDLEKAYVRKRAEFLRELQSTLQELDHCESQFGLPDWYDRFGYLIYDFIAMKYNK